jgi:hypothetical protein
MSGFWQVISQQGFKVHAVPENSPRDGSFGRLTGRKPVCGKVVGRNSWCMPTLFIQFEGPIRDEKIKPFPIDSSDIRHVCKSCAEIVKAANA